MYCNNLEAASRVGITKLTSTIIKEISLQPVGGSLRGWNSIPIDALQVSRTDAGNILLNCRINGGRSSTRSSYKLTTRRTLLADYQSAKEPNKNESSFPKKHNCKKTFVAEG